MTTPTCTCAIRCAGTKREYRALGRACPQHGDVEPAYVGAPYIDHPNGVTIG